jgi:hypothetical protein
VLFGWSLRGQENRIKPKERKGRGDSLVDVSVAESKLTLHVSGSGKLWALKSSLEIPLVHIAGVQCRQDFR